MSLTIHKKSNYAITVIRRNDIKNRLTDTGYFCPDICNLVASFFPVEDCKIPKKAIKKDIKKMVALSNKGGFWSVTLPKLKGGTVRITGTSFLKRLLNHFNRQIGKRNIKLSRTGQDVFDYVIARLKIMWSLEKGNRRFSIYDIKQDYVDYIYTLK